MLTDAQLEPLGLLPQPGIATAYPELVAEFNKLYSERMANLPWLPPGWVNEVLTINGKGGDIVFPVPTFRKDGSPINKPWPDFLQSEEARKVWQAIYERYREILVAYAAADAEKGRALLKSLYAASAFWDGLYRAAVAVRDAPGNAVNAVVNGATSALFGNLGALGWKVWVIVGIAGVGAFIYFAPRIKTAKSLIKVA